VDCDIMHRCISDRELNSQNYTCGCVDWCYNSYPLNSNHKTVSISYQIKPEADKIIAAIITKVIANFMSQ